MADPTKPHTGFVSLKSVTKGTPDPAAALDDIRRIYFKTTRETIEHDFAHALELLKALPDEDLRSKAHVFMEGLAEMQRDWGRGGESGRSGRSGRSGKSGGSKAAKAQNAVKATSTAKSKKPTPSDER